MLKAISILTLSSVMVIPHLCAKDSKGPITVEVLAVVNDTPITADDLDARIKMILVTSHTPVTEDNKKTLREQVLKNMIEELVQTQTAKKYKVAAKDKEISNTIWNIAKENKMTLEQLKAMFDANGIPLRTLQERISAGLSWVNFVRAAYASSVHVSDKEVDQQLANEKADQNKDQFYLFEIFLRADNQTSFDLVEKQARTLVQKIKAGGNFQVFAQQFSQSPSASKGGQVGWVKKNDVAPQPYETLEPGQISEPIRSNHGYYLYFLADKKEAGKSAVGETLFSYKKIVIPCTKGFEVQDDPYLATHLEALMTSPSTMEKVAKERGISVETVADKKLGHFSPEMRKFLEAIPLGKPSQPTLMAEGMVIVIPTDKRDAEPPKPLTREEVRAQLESEKLNKIAVKVLTQLLTKACIQVMKPEDFPHLQYGQGKKDITA